MNEVLTDADQLKRIYRRDNVLGSQIDDVMTDDDEGRVIGPIFHTTTIPDDNMEKSEEEIRTRLGTEYSMFHECVWPIEITRNDLLLTNVINSICSTSRFYKPKFVQLHSGGSLDHQLNLSPISFIQTLEEQNGNRTLYCSGRFRGGELETVVIQGRSLIVFNLNRTTLLFQQQLDGFLLEIQAIPLSICNTLTNVGNDCDGLLCLTMDSRLCILRWDIDGLMFKSCVDYGSLSSMRISSVYLTLLRNHELSPSSNTPRSPISNILYPTLIPAIDSQPSVINSWLNSTSGSRTVFDVCFPKRKSDQLSTPSMFVAIACHLNCVVVGNLTEVPSNDLLNERLSTLALLHMYRENRDRLITQEQFVDDANCRRFIEHLNIHLDRPTLMRQQADLDRSIASIFSSQSIVRALRVLAEDATRSNIPDSHHDLHVSVEVMDSSSDANSQALDSSPRYVSPSEIGAQLRFHTFGIPPPFSGLLLNCPYPPISVAWINTCITKDGYVALAALCKQKEKDQKIQCHKTQLAIFKVPVTNWSHHPNHPEELRESWEFIENPVLLPELVIDVLPLSTTVIPLNTDIGQFIVLGNRGLLIFYFDTKASRLKVLNRIPASDMSAHSTLHFPMEVSHPAAFINRALVAYLDRQSFNIPDVKHHPPETQIEDFLPPLPQSTFQHVLSIRLSESSKLQTNHISCWCFLPPCLGSPHSFMLFGDVDSNLYLVEFIYYDGTVDVSKIRKLKFKKLINDDEKMDDEILARPTENSADTVFMRINFEVSFTEDNIEILVLTGTTLSRQEMIIRIVADRSTSDGTPFYTVSSYLSPDLVSNKPSLLNGIYVTQTSKTQEPNKTRSTKLKRRSIFISPADAIGCSFNHPLVVPFLLTTEKTKSNLTLVSGFQFRSIYRLSLHSPQLKDVNTKQSFAINLITIVDYVWCFPVNHKMLVITTSSAQSTTSFFFVSFSQNSGLDFSGIQNPFNLFHHSLLIVPIIQNAADNILDSLLLTVATGFMILKINSHDNIVIVTDRYGEHKDCFYAACHYEFNLMVVATVTNELKLLNIPELLKLLLDREDKRNNKEYLATVDSILLSSTPITSPVIKRYEIGVTLVAIGMSNGSIAVWNTSTNEATTIDCLTLISDVDINTIELSAWDSQPVVIVGTTFGDIIIISTKPDRCESDWKHFKISYTHPIHQFIQLSNSIVLCISDTLWILDMEAGIGTANNISLNPILSHVTVTGLLTSCRIRTLSLLPWNDSIASLPLVAVDCDGQISTVTLSSPYFGPNCKPDFVKGSGFGVNLSAITELIHNISDPRIIFSIGTRYVPNKINSDSNPLLDEDKPISSIPELHRCPCISLIYLEPTSYSTPLSTLSLSTISQCRIIYHLPFNQSPTGDETSTESVTSSVVYTDTIENDDSQQRDLSVIATVPELPDSDDGQQVCSSHPNETGNLSEEPDVCDSNEKRKLSRIQTHRTPTERPVCACLWLLNEHDQEMVMKDQKQAPFIHETARHALLAVGTSVTPSKQRRGYSTGRLLLFRYRSNFINRFDVQSDPSSLVTVQMSVRRSFDFYSDNPSLQRLLQNTVSAIGCNDNQKRFQLTQQLTEQWSRYGCPGDILIPRPESNLNAITYHVDSSTDHCFIYCSIDHRSWLSGWIPAVFVSSNFIPSHALTPNILHRQGLPPAPQFFFELMARVCFQRPVTALSQSSDMRYLAVAAENLLYIFRLNPRHLDGSGTAVNVSDVYVSTNHQRLLDRLDSLRSLDPQGLEPNRLAPDNKEGSTLWTALTYVANRWKNKDNGSDSVSQQLGHQYPYSIRKSNVQPDVVAVRAVRTSIKQIQWIREENESETVVVTDALDGIFYLRIDEPNKTLIITAAPNITLAINSAQLLSMSSVVMSVAQKSLWFAAMEFGQRLVMKSVIQINESVLRMILTDVSYSGQIQNALLLGLNGGLYKVSQVCNQLINKQNDEVRDNSDVTSTLGLFRLSVQLQQSISLLLEVQALLLMLSVPVPCVIPPFQSDVPSTAVESSRVFPTPSQLSDTLSWDKQTDASLWDIREYINELIYDIKHARKSEVSKAIQLDVDRLLNLPIWEAPTRHSYQYSQSMEEKPDYEVESDGMSDDDKSNGTREASINSDEDSPSFTEHRDAKKARRNSDVTQEHPISSRRNSFNDSYYRDITRKCPGGISVNITPESSPFRTIENLDNSFDEFCFPSRLQRMAREAFNPLGFYGDYTHDPKQLATGLKKVRELSRDWLNVTQQRLLALGLKRSALLMNPNHFQTLRNELFPTHSMWWIERHAGLPWGQLDSEPHFIIRQAELKNSSSIRRYYSFLSNLPSLPTSFRFALGRMLHSTRFSHGTIVSAPIMSMPSCSDDKSSIPNSPSMHTIKSFVPLLPSSNILDLDLLTRLISLSAASVHELQLLLDSLLDKPRSSVKRTTVQDVKFALQLVLTFLQPSKS